MLDDYFWLPGNDDIQDTIAGFKLFSISSLLIPAAIRAGVSPSSLLGGEALLISQVNFEESLFQYQDRRVICDCPTVFFECAM